MTDLPNEEEGESGKKNWFLECTSYRNLRQEKLTSFKRSWYGRRGLRGKFECERCKSVSFVEEVYATGAKEGDKSFEKVIYKEQD